MDHLKQQFGTADVHSVGQRYSFDAKGNMTGQVAISGMGGNVLEASMNQTADAVAKPEDLSI